MGVLAETCRNATQSNGRKSAQRPCGATSESAREDFEGRSLDATPAASYDDRHTESDPVALHTQ